MRCAIHDDRYTSEKCSCSDIVKELRLALVEACAIANRIAPDHHRPISQLARIDELLRLVP